MNITSCSARAVLARRRRIPRLYAGASMPVLKIEIPQPVDACPEELASGVREVLLSAGLCLTEVHVSVLGEQEPPT
jgi:hypothetical protein